MLTQTLMIVASVAFVFVMFGLSLAWAIARTRSVRTPGASYFDNRK